MNRKNKQLIRILALVLVVLLAGGAVLSALVSVLAEESAPARDQYELRMEYMEDEQALHITQRLVYQNPSAQSLDRVIFQAACNMFRRESALIYENDVLGAAFPEGFTPAGIDLRSVRCNGESVDWGYQGEKEMLLRVSCDLTPGESCVFEFDYYLLLSRNCAMAGVSDTDVRLSAFVLQPGVWDEHYAEFVTYSPLQHTRWLFADPADYSVTLTLPDLYLPAATGREALVSTENHISIWQIEAENVRDFALSFGKRYRETIGATGSDVTVRVLSNHRGASSVALECAVETIDQYEIWFGSFPFRSIDLVQTDYAAGALSHSGAIWIPDALWTDDAALKQAIRLGLAQQLFGLTAAPEPVYDAWLSDVPSAYIALLALEESEGYNAFVRSLNDQVLDSLRITIPGGLYITADASLFTAEDYETVVLNRGTVVMHELRVAMGRESLLAGLRNFYEYGRTVDVVGEYDLVDALDSATGGDWEDFLTEWLFNVDDYIGQQIEYYE